ncbi:MAG: S-layer homology domain-containing protein [Clostridia bacterium]|nr:S-layer homology domain-containing protein [Clostridia bacterium]
MKFKKYMAIIVSLILVLTIGLTASATEESTAPVSTQDTKFSDVSTDHWAYEAIMLMSERKIINGYSDNTFKPDNPVTRAEFATMMVAALELPLKNPEEATYKDVTKDHWAFKFVETARYYLTGFKTSKGLYFKPSNQAVREDMAVALVKALGYDNETVGQDVLKDFADREKISVNLRKYVAIAVKKNIMGGKPGENGTKVFDPQSTLTRAEAAALLSKVVQDEKITDEMEEKVTDSKDTPSEDEEEKIEYIAPQVSGKSDGKKIVLSWKPISSKAFEGYKVVISKNNTNPSYPDDGYLYYITDKNRTTVTIDNSEAYKNGDFGKYLKSGEKYYFSVTAIYKDKRVAGNVVTLTYPVTENDEESKPVSYTTPKVTAQVDGSRIIIKWQAISHEKLSGYKVVISKNNSAPKYPDDGYLYWITNKNQTSAVVDNKNAYNGGDFGKYLTPGQKYYFSVTAVYDDRKVPGNVVALTFPKTTQNNEANTSSGSAVTTLTGKVEGGKIVLNWKPVARSEKFVYYKVVISKKNPRPVYPEDGYLYYFTDINTSQAIVEGGQGYSGGDFDGYIAPGQTYYFSITTVYNDSKLPGNVIKLTCPR